MPSDTIGLVPQAVRQGVGCSHQLLEGLVERQSAGWQFGQLASVRLGVTENPLAPMAAQRAPDAVSAVTEVAQL